MSYHYLNPADEQNKYSIPNLEVFYADRGEWGIRVDGEMVDYDPNGDHEAVQPNDEGWYYRFCFPGCLPDSEPFGPFDTDLLALEAARETHGDEYQ